MSTNTKPPEDRRPLLINTNRVDLVIGLIAAVLILAVAAKFIHHEYTTYRGYEANNHITAVMDAITSAHPDGEYPDAVALAKTVNAPNDLPVYVIPRSDPSTTGQATLSVTNDGVRVSVCASVNRGWTDVRCLTRISPGASMSRSHGGAEMPEACATGGCGGEQGWPEPWLAELISPLISR